MGNPSILPGIPLAGPAIPPPRQEVTWAVYRLWHAGRRLTADEAMRTRLLGHLELCSVPNSRPLMLTARLWDPAGHPVLANLYDVHGIRGERGGGLLLQGVVTHWDARSARDLRQAWWCVVHSVVPLSEEQCREEEADAS